MRRILFINPFGLGDAIFTLRVLETVKVADPLCYIGFLGNERTEELLKLASAVDRVFVFNRDLYRRLWREDFWECLARLEGLTKQIRKEKFDSAIDVSLGREYALGAFFSGIHRRVGFDYKGRGTFLNRKVFLSGYQDKRVTDKQMELLAKAKLSHGSPQGRVSFKISEKISQEAEAFLRACRIEPGEAVFAVAPGGGKSWGENARYKQWDLEKFASVANERAAKRNEKIILLGDESEESLLRQLGQRLRAPHAIACGFSIEKVAALLKRSSFLLCNDGGLMHLADSLGVRVVAIFGPVDEKVYGPYGDVVGTEVITEPVPCRPCYRNFHFPACQHQRQCLDKVTAEKVITHLEKLS